MFDEYQRVLDEAKAAEITLHAKQNSKIEQNTIEIQTQMSAEVEKMSKNILLVNYNPVEYYNKITILKHTYDRLVQEKEKELQVLKKKFDSRMESLMCISITNHVTEMYKIIGNNSQNCYVTKVYFTLIKTAYEKPGDPIRIEIINMQGLQMIATYKTVKGQFERIPQFPNSTSIAPGDNMYTMPSAPSQQKKWWLEWVKANRPIPEQP